MNTTFTARHIETGRDLEQYSLNELPKLQQFFDRIISCDIILEPANHPDNPCRAELKVRVPKQLLHASEEAATWELAINRVIDTMIRQIKKYKTKHFEHS